jgi:hypothetical protein
MHSFIFMQLEIGQVINDAGIRLRLTRSVIGTAQLIGHRFLRTIESNDDDDFDMYDIAAAALFIGAKHLETFRCADSLALVMSRLAARNSECDGDNKDDKDVHRLLLAPLRSDSDGFRSFGMRLFDLEKAMLLKLGFRLPCERDLPHRFVVPYANAMLELSDVVLQSAWSYANDSLLCADLCLERSADVLAVGAIHLAALDADVQLPDRWHSLFDVPLDVAESIAATLRQLVRKQPRSRGEAKDKDKDVDADDEGEQRKKKQRC